MNNNTSNTNIQSHSPRGASTRGVALVFTLLVLSLMMVLSLGMVLALSSQTFISGYYRNFRGAFYAADSGANIARVAMINEISSLVPGTVALGVPPLTVGTINNTNANTVQTFINNTYGASWSALNGGQSAGSWPGQFELNSGAPATFAFANCHLSYNWAISVAAPLPDPAPGAYSSCTPLPPANKMCSTAAGILANCYVINNFQYTYSYTIDTLGKVLNSEQAEILDNGTISITVNISQPSSVTKAQSFAAWGMFIDQQTACSPGQLANGTLTGPVFTNGAWTFGSGSYIFTDSVGQALATAGARFSTNSCNGSETSFPQTSSGTTVSPTFNNGLNLHASAVSLPANSYSQKWAVLDGIGQGEAGPTNPPPTVTGSNMNANNMQKASGAASLWPSSGNQPSSGVYMGYVANNATMPSNSPFQNGSGKCSATSPFTGCMTGGGIYVEGNASVSLQATTVGGHSAQVFTIVNNGQTTTVTIDLVANTTTFQTGGNTQKLVGVPENLGATSPSEAVMLYVDGDITSLAGAGTASVQDGSAVTITANGDMTITGNITYKTEPVTTTQNQIAGTPADTLIPNSNNGQVLGLFTATGNVNMSVANNANLEIDASIATISSGGSGGLQIANSNNTINNLTIIGGRIQNTIQNIGATTRNVFFDRRFAQGGFAPPWFPSTTVTSTPTGVENSTVSTPTAQRVQWTCKSCQ